MMYYCKRAVRMIRLLGKKIGNRNLSINCRTSDVSLETELRIHNGGRIVVHDHISTYGRTTIAASGLVEIDSACINRHALIACMNHIKIGKDCKLGPMVILYDHDHQFGPEGVEDGFRVGEVVIGDNVWIGANSVILRDTHIGDNCVIGAGCVVQGNIPDHSLVTMDRTLKITLLQKR